MLKKTLSELCCFCCGDPLACLQAVACEVGLLGQCRQFKKALDSMLRKLMASIKKGGFTEFEAEEILLEAVAGAYEAASRYTGSASFSTYVYRIFLNKTADHVRKKVKNRDLALALRYAASVHGSEVESVKPSYDDTKNRREKAKPSVPTCLRHDLLQN